MATEKQFLFGRSRRGHSFGYDAVVRFSESVITDEKGPIRSDRKETIYEWARNATSGDVLKYVSSGMYITIICLGSGQETTL